MAHQPDGPLAGAPISFPQEDVPTCAPVLGPFISVEAPGLSVFPLDSNIVDGGAPNPVIQVEEGESPATVTIDVLNMEDPGLGEGASLAIVEVIGFAGLSPDMPITSVVFTPSTAPDYSTLVIVFDTGNVNTGDFGSLVITNDAGCSTQILISIIAAP